MSRSVPLLTKQLIQAELTEMCKQGRKHYLFAFFGEGSDTTVDLVDHGRFYVHSIKSELELREQMLNLNEEEPKKVFLVPWTGEVPVDLAGRFVLNGKVRRIGRETRLKQLFGALEVEESALNSLLAGYLLDQDFNRRFSIRGNRLSLTSMWTSWLKERWNVPIEGALALDQLVGWAAANSHGPGLRETLNESVGDGDSDALMNELYKVLNEALGPAGPAVFRLWEINKGQIALESAILFEPLLRNDDPAVAMWIRQYSKRQLPLSKDDDAEDAARLLGNVAGLALAQYRNQLSESDVRRVIRSADEIPDEPKVRAALESSNRLPSSWNLRFEKLGRLLSKSAAKPNEQAVQESAGLLRAVSEHDYFKQSEQTLRVKRAEMSVRLLAWLSENPIARLEAGLSADADVENLGRWYAEEGGYVDWARHAARGKSVGIFEEGVQAVLESADKIRQQLDRRFARSLKAWHEAGQLANQSTKVMPIHQCSERIIAKFLAGNDERLLLVLLMDGMSWAQTAELLESAEHSNSPWAPLEWHQCSDGRIGTCAYPVMTAALPTLTHVSRAAFFSGKPVAPGLPEDTSKDVARWRENKALARFFEGSDAPRLLLRAEGHNTDGFASNEALSMVQDKKKRTVAMVINAPDSLLHADPQTELRFGIESIRSLTDLLGAARDAGRVVLLASDHGHVRSDCMKSVPCKEKGGERWRPIFSETEEVKDYEIFLQGQSAWAPKGALGVALLVDDTMQYGPVIGAGSHGGASLSEVITPCVLIGPDDFQAGDSDKALRTTKAFVPGWWHFNLRKAEKKTIPQKKTDTKKATESAQLSFPILKNEIEDSHPAYDKTSELGKYLLFKFKEQIKGKDELCNQAVKAVMYLLSKNGISTSHAFAAEMNVLVNRVSGLVASLQEILNIDAYPILEFDYTGKQVSLDREKLAQQFEVTL